MDIQVPKDITLIEDEIPIWFGHRSWVSLWPLLLIAVICLFTIFLIFISIILLILSWIEISTSEYFISSKRIYIKRGLISRTLNDIKIEWITNIYINQTISGRILNFGNVGISTPGEHGGTIRFIGVAEPMGIKSIIEKVIVIYKKTP